MLAKVLSNPTRSALPHIGEYKKVLADYYEIEDKIPEVYFDLPSKKKPFPSTYQELNHAVRRFFPFNPTTSRILLSEVVAELREYYTFKLLPNDYFSVRFPLPKETDRIKTLTQFTFPITDDQEAKEFIKQITPYYRFKLPLPEHIMQANPTNKPALPEIDQIMEDFNFTFPIATPKQLTETARELRKYYYFTQLPSEWIQIITTEPTEAETNTPPLPHLPDNIEDLNTALAGQNIELTLPITSQQNVTSTMQIL